MPYRNSTFTLHCSDAPPGWPTEGAWPTDADEQHWRGLTMLGLENGRAVLTSGLHHPRGVIGMLARVEETVLGSPYSRVIMVGRIAALGQLRSNGQQTILIEEEQHPRGTRLYSPAGPSDQESWIAGRVVGAEERAAAAHAYDQDMANQMLSDPRRQAQAIETWDAFVSRWMTRNPAQRLALETEFNAGWPWGIALRQALDRVQTRTPVYEHGGDMPATDQDPFGDQDVLPLHGAGAWGQFLVRFGNLNGDQIRRMAAEFESGWQWRFHLVRALERAVEPVDHARVPGVTHHHEMLDPLVRGRTRDVALLDDANFGGGMPIAIMDQRNIEGVLLDSVQTAPAPDLPVMGGHPETWATWLGADVWDSLTESQRTILTPRRFEVDAQRRDTILRLVGVVPPSFDEPRPMTPDEWAALGITPPPGPATPGDLNRRSQAEMWMQYMGADRWNALTAEQRQYLVNDGFETDATLRFRLLRRVGVPVSERGPIPTPPRTAWHRLLEPDEPDEPPV